MSVFSEQDIQDMIAVYIQAERDVLSGKVVRRGDSSWTREDLPAIRAGRKEWERKLSGVRNNTSRFGVVEFY